MLVTVEHETTKQLARAIVKTFEAKVNGGLEENLWHSTYAICTQKPTPKRKVAHHTHRFGPDWFTMQLRRRWMSATVAV
jgi:hypothetical protein